MTSKKTHMTSNNFDAMRNAVKNPTQQLKSSIYRIPRSLISLQNSASYFTAATKAAAKIPNPAQMFPAQARMNEWMLKNQDFLFSLNKDNLHSPSEQLHKINIHNPALDTNEKLDKVAELLENMVDVLNEQSEHQKKVEAWHEEDLKRYENSSKQTKSESRKSWVNILLVAATLVATICAIFH